MKTVTYTCDWCHANSPKDKTFEVWLMKAGDITRERSSFEMCSTCADRLKQRTEAQRKEGQA